MRLNNPGSPDRARRITAQLRQNLMNTPSHGYGAEAQKDAFLNWCEDLCRPQLRNLFAPSEDILDALEESYNRVLLGSAMSERRLNGLVQTEREAWERRLRLVDEELIKQQAVAGRPGVPVVLDTSVFVAGMPFMTFDWRSLHPALASGPVRLVAPILVVEELDDLLHDRDDGRRQRARAATRELRSLHERKPTEPAALPGKPDVTIEVMLDGGWHRRRPNTDAEIVDQALQLKELTAREVLLAACGLRQIYYAGAVGLLAVSYPRSDEVDQVAGPTA